MKTKDRCFQLKCENTAFQRDLENTDHQCNHKENYIRVSIWQKETINTTDEAKR